MVVLYLIFALLSMVKRNDDVAELRRYDFSIEANDHQMPSLFDADVVEGMTTTTTTWPWNLVAFVHRHQTEYNKVNDDARIFIPLLRVLLLMERKTEKNALS